MLTLIIKTEVAQNFSFYLHVASEIVGSVADLEVPGAAVGAGRALCRAVLQRRDLGWRASVSLAARVLVELAAVWRVHWKHASD